MLYRLLTAIFLCLGCSSYLCANEATTAENKYGHVTPSHVFSIWVNINNVLLKMETKEVQNDLSGINVVPVSDKVPKDVLDQANIFRNKLDLLRKSVGLKNTKTYKKPSEIKDVSPHIVFINSTMILESLFLYQKSQVPQSSIFPFQKHLYKNTKTPSDVYAQVTLAIKRLDRLLYLIGLTEKHEHEEISVSLGVTL